MMRVFLMNVAGIEIPSNDPIFLAVVLGIHIPLGLACVALGLIAMFSKKGRGRHSTCGKIYFWCLLMLTASATYLSLVRWSEKLSFVYSWDAVLRVGVVWAHGDTEALALLL
jgi:uncharacterized membrane protein